MGFAWPPPLAAIALLKLSSGSPSQEQLLHLHMGAHTEQQPQVHAQRPDVGASLAGHPKHHQVALLIKLYQLAAEDGANPQLPLHRGDEGRPLEQGTCSGQPWFEGRPIQLHPTALATQTASG